MLSLQQRCGYFSLSCLVLVSKIFYPCIENAKRFKSGNCTEKSKAVDSSEGSRELLGGFKNTGATDAFFFNLQAVRESKKAHTLQRRRLKRECDRVNSSLPRFFSACFGCFYLFKEDDLKEKTTLGRGPGGQATNRRKQTVILSHGPSGIIIRFGRFPSLWCNRRAARKLLNLRLEERLLGEESKLGQEKAMRERRCRRRQRRTERLLVKINAAELRRSAQHDYFSFLKGLKPLPVEAVAQIPIASGAFTGQKIFISTLFDAQCNNWWPILQGAFASTNASFNKDGLPAGPGTRCVSLPLLLEYLFPFATASSNSNSLHTEDLQLEQCRHDAEAMANVQRAFRCFSEMFGLRLKALTQADGLPRIALVTDGLNWLEMKARMADPLDGRPTAFARAVWPQVYFSLRALKLKPEATSVKNFFRREVKKHGSIWGKEIFEAMS